MEFDMVTEADIASNTFLVERIKERYPKHGIISEEFGEYQKDAEYVWTIDPLDGTFNFLKKIPLFAVMVALMKNNSTLLAAIYDPVHNEFLFAHQGAGAYLNGRRIQCSETRQWKESSGCISPKLKLPRIEIIRKLLGKAEKDCF